MQHNFAGDLGGRGVGTFLEIETTDNGAKNILAQWQFGCTTQNIHSFPACHAIFKALYSFM